jgi:hypothetical protein
LSGISANTVRNTLARVFAKAGVSNRAELAYFSARRDGTPSRPPRPQANRVPSSNWHAFAARVREASHQDLSPESARPPTKASSTIVYTPPQSACAPPR